LQPWALASNDPITCRHTLTACQIETFSEACPQRDILKALPGSSQSCPQSTGWENRLDFFDHYAYSDEFALGWRSSGVEQLICNQPVGGSNPFASSGRNAAFLV
jgi:hypothetical protein